MEPWYKVVIPRQELREGRSLDPSEIAQAKVAIFVGNSWDAKPGLETPWLDIADQLAGEKGRALFSKNAPGTKTIGDLLRLVGQPVLFLFDEVLNYIGRHPEQVNQ